MHLAIGFDPKSASIYKDHALSTATPFTRFDDER